MSVIRATARQSGTLSSQGLVWTAENGNNAVRISPEWIEVAPTTSRATSQAASATARLGILLRTKNVPWSVSFEVRFGSLATQAAGVYLRSDTTLVAQVEASAAGGKIVTRVGGKVVDSFSPVGGGAEEWHTFRFVGNGDKDVIEVWKDGSKVGEVASPLVPDTIRVGSASNIAVAGKQTAVTIRHVAVSAQRAAIPAVPALQPNVIPTNTGNIAVSSTAPSPSTTTLSPIPPDVVQDDFKTGLPLAGLWENSNIAGTLVFQQGELMLLPSRKGDHFPCLVSRRGAFPAGASWKVTIRFRYPRSGPYGVGMRIVNSRGQGAVGHYDPSLGRPLFTLAARRQFLTTDPAAWHDFVIENKAGKWTVWLDGEAFATDLPHPQTESYDLLIGHIGPKMKPWEWTTLSLKYVRIEWTDGPRPTWLGDRR
jgi:hypothetical protein